MNPYSSYCDNRAKLAGEFVAVGYFESALNTLKKTIGARNFPVLKEIFSEAYLAS